MVSLARSAHVPRGDELILVIWTRSQPLREMLSLLSSRRGLSHRSFDGLDALVAFVIEQPLARVLVLVGPDITESHVRRLERMFESIDSSCVLVVFEDAMEDGEPPDWSTARVRPSLRAAVPPRMVDVLRVIDEFIALGPE